MKKIWSFVLDQYLILFFIGTLGAKLAFFNGQIIHVVWPTNQYLCGVVFGFFSVAIIFSPLFFIRKRKNLLAIILATIITLIILIDSIYYSYFYALPNIAMASSIGQTKDIGPAIWSLLIWWYPLYFIDIAIALITLKPVRALAEKLREKFDLPRTGRNAAAIAFILIVIMFGFKLATMGKNSLQNFVDRGYDTVSTAQHYGVLISHSVDVARFIQQETTHLSSDEIKEITDWVKDNKPPQSTSDLTGIAKGKNVIMVQVESLGAFVINQKVNGKEVTPNLNKLSTGSYYFPNERFLYGAGHTSDTDFVANSSYFPLDDAAVFIRYCRDNFTGLPKLLTDKDYSAYAYHGFNRNFWNRNISLKSLGYQKFYAADNYPKGWKVNMGLNDGDFLNKTADYIKDQPKPSLSYVVTLSSHVPFFTTKETEEFGVDKSKYPDQVGGYLNDINYTDRMLGKFFEKLKSYKLYDDSLILVYGDHTPVLSAFTAGTIKYDPSSVQRKEVPLFIKLPKQTKGQVVSNKGVHLDIMPTVLDLLGIKTNQLMFGRSLFADKSDSYQTCDDQFETFTSLGDCKTSLQNEKNISAKIIHYNLFDNLPK